MRLLLVVMVVGGCGGNQAGSDACHADGECPVHQKCESGVCTTGCIGVEECGVGLTCSSHGRCVPIYDADASQNDLAAAPGADLTATAADLSDAVASPDLATGCGDEKLDPGEACDEGADNSDDPASDATCTTLCQRRARCGALAGSSGAQIDPESGHCYVAWPSPVPWATAQERCRAQGGALAVLDGAAEEARVKALAGGDKRWLGLGASNSDGDCTLIEGGTVKDAPCGWPSSGLLPASPASTAGWVRESGCGNGVVEPGEGCDPPGPSCTNTCQTIRACSEGMSSPATGHCYFVVGPASDYNGAMGGCPAGTHLATLDSPEETELARKLITNDTWIGLRAPTNVGQFSWDVAGESFFSARYHGFITDEPNHNSSPTCVRLITTGWRDQVCNSSYVRLCERE